MKRGPEQELINPREQKKSKNNEPVAPMNANDDHAAAIIFNINRDVNQPLAHPSYKFENYLHNSQSVQSQVQPSIMTLDEFSEFCINQPRQSRKWMLLKTATSNAIYYMVDNGAKFVVKYPLAMLPAPLYIIAKPMADYLARKMSKHYKEQADKMTEHVISDVGHQLSKIEVFKGNEKHISENEINPMTHIEASQQEYDRAASIDDDLQESPVGSGAILSLYQANLEDAIHCEKLDSEEDPKSSPRQGF